MSLIGKPEYVNKERLKKHVQAGMVYLANIFLACAAVVYIADEDWPIRKKALLGAAVGVVIAGLVAGGVWLVYVWQ